MNKRLARDNVRRALARGTWVSVFGERRGKKKVWACTFCGVIGSHRRGCHYVTEAHHRERKTVRRDFLGTRTRVQRLRVGPARVGGGNVNIHKS